MRAVRFDKFGEPASVLKLDDVPMPEPGAGKVRLRLTHCSLNPADLATIRGMYGRLPKLPGTPGMEGMGVVDAVGAGVKGISLSTRMIPLSIAGSWQEYAIVRPELLLPVPEGVSDQSAAQFVVNPISAWVMLTQDLNLQAGDWVLQTAAGSTLGRLVIQIARLKGYKTINFVRRPEQVDELLELGADAAYCTDESDLAKRVRAKTGGAGATGALDAVGGETGALALRCIRPSGTMLAYGMLSNQPTRSATERCFSEAQRCAGSGWCNGFAQHLLRTWPRYSMNSWNFLQKATSSRRSTVNLTSQNSRRPSNTQSNRAVPGKCFSPDSHPINERCYMFNMVHPHAIIVE